MKKVFFVIVILIFCLFLYAKYISPSELEIKEYSIESTKLPEGFDGMKIVHFSDVLYQNEQDLEMLKKIVKKINNQKPDIIVYTGDFLGKKINDKTKDKLISELSKLNADYKYAITGDKDKKGTSDIFTYSGFTYLNNASEYIFNNDTEPILIAGGNDLSEESLLYDEDIEYHFIISLIHKPDDFDKLDYKSTLVLAGHSLGGQIRVPFWGALIRENGAKKYTNDYYKENSSSLYISYGIGLGKLNLRLFDKPSFNVYRLYTK